MTTTPRESGANEIIKKDISADGINNKCCNDIMSREMEQMEMVLCYNNSNIINIIITNNNDDNDDDDESMT